jgi:hypothetical protein
LNDTYNWINDETSQEVAIIKIQKDKVL